MVSITIQGREFNAPTPYSAGHSLSENEASAFNQLLHENLRNNFAKTVKNADEAQKAGKPAVSQEDLQRQFDEYASKYEFGVRKSGGGGDSSLPKDPTLRQAHSMAREAIRALAKKKSFTVSAEWVASKVPEFLEKNPAYLEEARRRVESQASISVEELDFSDAQASRGEENGGGDSTPDEQDQAAA